MGSVQQRQQPLRETQRLITYWHGATPVLMSSSVRFPHERAQTTVCRVIGSHRLGGCRDVEV
jgi:hypothetical protein